MATNYTNEQVSYMIDKYNEAPTRDTVQILAEELGKSTKSIIGKLSREGVYQKHSMFLKQANFPLLRKN